MTKHLKILDYLSKNRGEESYIPIDNLFEKIGIKSEEYKYEILNNLRYRQYIVFSDGKPYDMFGDGDSGIKPVFTAKLELDGIEHLQEYRLKNRNIIITNRAVQVAIVTALIAIASLAYTVYQNNISNQKDVELKEIYSINKRQRIELGNTKNQLQKANKTIEELNRSLSKHPRK